jgi:hypothetical protein
MRASDAYLTKKSTQNIAGSENVGRTLGELIFHP